MIVLKQTFKAGCARYRMFKSCTIRFRIYLLRSAEMKNNISTNNYFPLLGQNHTESYSIKNIRSHPLLLSSSFSELSLTLAYSTIVYSGMYYLTGKTKNTLHFIEFACKIIFYFQKQ